MLLPYKGKPFCDLFCWACVCNNQVGCPLFGGQYPMALGRALIITKALVFEDRLVEGVWNDKISIFASDIQVNFPNYVNEPEQ